MARGLILFLFFVLRAGEASALGYSYFTIDPPAAVVADGNGAAGADAISDNGQIVGSFYDGSAWHEFLYDGSTYTTIDVPGATGIFARGVNDSGWIVGSYGDTIGGNAFIAKPVPEPSLSLLTVCGLAFLALGRRRLAG